MSSTVWYEQVDTALLSMLSRITVNGKSPDVRIKKPDEDFKKEDYPIISIYNVFSKRDDFRKHHNGPVVVSRDKENNTMIMEEPCLPYNLHYQIDFWALQQSQVNAMTVQWIALTNGGKDFNLDVVDTGGEERSCYCLCTDDFKKVDVVENNTRIFHSAITYRIYVEID